jgi:hypothetical protein
LLAEVRVIISYDKKAEIATDDLHPIIVAEVGVGSGLPFERISVMIPGYKLL